MFRLAKWSSKRGVKVTPVVDEWIGDGRMDCWCGNSNRQVTNKVLGNGLLSLDGYERTVSSSRIRSVIDAVSDLTATHVETDVTATDAGGGRRNEYQTQNNNLSMLSIQILPSQNKSENSSRIIEIILVKILTDFIFGAERCTINAEWIRWLCSRECVESFENSTFYIGAQTDHSWNSRHQLVPNALVHHLTRSY